MKEEMEALLTRRSIRSYRPDPVPQEVIDRVTEAGLYAASGMGRQSAIIIQVTDPTVRDRLSQINASILHREGSDPFYGAPTVLMVLADRNVPTYLYDGSLCMGNMMLAAHAMGLGSCWIHRAKETFECEEGRAFLRSLGIGDTYEGIGNLILGYPQGEIPVAKERRPGRVYRI